MFPAYAAKLGPGLVVGEYRRTQDNAVANDLGVEFLRGW